jgi:spore germination protein GerM
MMRSWTLLPVAVILGTITACSIQPEASPDDIPQEQRDVFVDRETGDEAAGSNTIYLLVPSDPDEPQRLRSVSRDVPTTPASILRSLFAGPNAEERDEQLDTAIPAGLELLSARTVGQVLTVDVVDAFDELTSDGLRFAVAQIVSTADGIEGVRSVQLQIDGEPRVWPLGNGELTDRPLTVYDYPGIIESTQPAYPAIPSPSR